MKYLIAILFLSAPAFAGVNTDLGSIEYIASRAAYDTSLANAYWYFGDVQRREKWRKSARALSCKGLRVAKRITRVTSTDDTRGIVEDFDDCCRYLSGENEYRGQNRSKWGDCKIYLRHAQSTAICLLTGKKVCNIHNIGLPRLP